MGGLLCLQSSRVLPHELLQLGDLAENPADQIFADEVTITASIGVVGGKLITKGLWDKLGVNWVPYKRGARADFFNSVRRFNDKELEVLERYMREVYEVFKGRADRSRWRRAGRAPSDRGAP